VGCEESRSIDAVKRRAGPADGGLVSSHEEPRPRVIAAILGGAIRLLLGSCLAVATAYLILYGFERVMISRSETGEVVLANVWLTFGAAVLNGVAVAVVCDRVWLRVRRMGPRLRR
jgi:hypothetical protein